MKGMYDKNPEFIEKILSRDKNPDKEKFAENITKNLKDFLLSVKPKDFSKPENLEYGNMLINEAGKLQFVDVLDISNRDDEVEGVFMGEIVIIGPKSPRKKAYTTGAVPCICIAGYDRENKIGFVGHIHCHTSRDDLEKFLKSFMEKNNTKKLEFCISGADESTQLNLMTVLDIAKSNPKIELKGARIHNSHHDGESMGLDIEAGGFYSDFSNHKYSCNLSEKHMEDLAIQGRMFLFVRDTEVSNEIKPSFKYSSKKIGFNSNIFN